MATKIFIIDDDASVSRSMALLLGSSGYDVESYQSAGDFLESENYGGKGCILLDIHLNGESGLELQDAIKSKFPNLPIIYFTGQGDIPMSVQALKKGAINFLQKPIDESNLFLAVDEAMNKSDEMITILIEQNSFRSLIDSLTLREYEIFTIVIKGMLNKQIAGKLNIAEHTVKIHRGNITEKLGVKSVAEMVHIAEVLHIKAI